MPILFCNIGWMEKYEGIKGDSIARGGAFNKLSIGSEVCNFSDVNGTMYGFVNSKGKINIDKLGANNNDSIDGVTVVWTAGPPNGGTVIVGWYKNATVYRELKEFKKELKKFKKTPKLQLENRVIGYRVTADAASATVLPVDEREFVIPRNVKGGMGRSNIWYADKPEVLELVQRVQEMISGGNVPRIPDIDRDLSGTEGNQNLVTHLRRERNAALVKAKKTTTLKATGKLCCEACGFDFVLVYGDIGKDFCEVHHLTRLADATTPVKTELKDLAVLCSNCHRIIHRKDPMLSVVELNERVKIRSQNAA
jgi:5-methylcytosine-specific restriction protein A